MLGQLLCTASQGSYLLLFCYTMQLCYRPFLNVRSPGCVAIVHCLTYLVACLCDHLACSMAISQSFQSIERVASSSEFQMIIRIDTFRTLLDINTRSVIR